MDDNDRDIGNLNDDETLYFSDDRDFEQERAIPNSEEYMHENYRPLTNTNSVEYDEDDYESVQYEEDFDAEGNRKVIIAYIFSILAIMLVVLIAFLNL